MKNIWGNQPYKEDRNHGCDITFTGVDEVKGEMWEIKKSLVKLEAGQEINAHRWLPR